MHINLGIIYVYVHELVSMYVNQCMIYVLELYLMLCYQIICDGTPIELYLVTFGLNPRLITSKIESTVYKTSLHIKTVY